MAHYTLVTSWQLDAPVDRVWDALLRSAEWPEWWRGFRSVERLASGDDDGVGMRLRQRWRSLLPYTLTLDLEILRVEQQRRLEGRSSGDMAGTCTWTFEARDGGTLVGFVMDVRPTKAWMNLPLPFSGKIVALNYQALMRWGRDGLAARRGQRTVDEAVRAGLAGA